MLKITQIKNSNSMLLNLKINIFAAEMKKMIKHSKHMKAIGNNRGLL